MAPSPSSSSSQSRCHSAIQSTCRGYGIKQDRQGPLILGEEAVGWQEPKLAGEALQEIEFLVGVQALGPRAG